MAPTCLTPTLMAITCLSPTELAPRQYELYIVDTFAELVEIDVSDDSLVLTAQSVAIVNGNIAAGDGGGGVFTLDESSSTTTNGFSVSATSTGTGRWKAVHGIRKLTQPAVNAAGQPGDYYLSNFYRFDCIANATWRRVALGSY